MVSDHSSSEYWKSHHDISSLYDLVFRNNIGSEMEKMGLKFDLLDFECGIVKSFVEDVVYKNNTILQSYVGVNSRITLKDQRGWGCPTMYICAHYFADWNQALLPKKGYDVITIPLDTMVDPIKMYSHASERLAEVHLIVGYNIKSEGHRGGELLRYLLEIGSLYDYYNDKRLQDMWIIAKKNCVYTPKLEKDIDFLS